MGQKRWATDGHFPQGPGRGAVGEQLSPKDDAGGTWLKSSGCPGADAPSHGTAAGRAVPAGVALAINGPDPGNAVRVSFLPQGDEQPDSGLHY